DMRERTALEEEINSAGYRVGGGVDFMRRDEESGACHAREHRHDLAPAILALDRVESLAGRIILVSRDENTDEARSASGDQPEAAIGRGLRIARRREYATPEKRQIYGGFVLNERLVIQ